jgi:hypothetical protein
MPQELQPLVLLLLFKRHSVVGVVGVEVVVKLLRLLH